MPHYDHFRQLRRLGQIAVGLLVTVHQPELLHEGVVTIGIPCANALCPGRNENYFTLTAVMMLGSMKILEYQ